MKRYWLAFAGLEALFLATLGFFVWAEMPFWALIALGVTAVLALAVGMVLLLAKRKDDRK